MRKKDEFMAACFHTAEKTGFNFLSFPSLSVV